MKKSTDMTLEELALLSDEDAREAIRNSKLSNSGTYLEIHFRSLRQYFGAVGLDDTRRMVFESGSTGAAASLMMNMIDLLSVTDLQAANYIKLKELSYHKYLAAKRWKTEERATKKALLDNAVEIVRGHLIAKKHENWCHNDFAAQLLRSPEFESLKEDERKLRAALANLFRQMGLEDRIFGTHKIG